MLSNVSGTITSHLPPPIPIRGTSPNLASARRNQSQGSSAISSEAVRFRQTMDRYNSLTHINGQQVQQLRAVNNKLTILWNLPYRFQTAGGMFSYILFNSHGTNWNNLFANVYREIGAEGDFFGHDVFQNSGNSFAILSKLAGGIGEFINCLYCRTEIIATLDAVGIEPGWVELNNGHETNRFYFSKCGTIYSEAASNSQREFMNTWDWREWGHEVGDKIMVNFEYFTVGEDGRIYVPKGVPAIMGTTFWIPSTAETGKFWGWEQDESGNWNRDMSFFPPFISVASPEHEAKLLAKQGRTYSPSAPERYGWGSSGSGNINIQATINSYAEQLLDVAMTTSNNSSEWQGREISVSRMDTANIPQSWLLHLSLIRETRNNSVAPTPENFLEDSLRSLATAFEARYDEINSDSSTYVDCLEDALFISVNSIFFMEMRGDSNLDFLQITENARKKAEIFTSEFLRHFRELGAGAFEFAWLALQA